VTYEERARRKAEVVAFCEKLEREQPRPPRQPERSRGFRASDFQGEYEDDVAMATGGGWEMAWGDD
jgi:hypothetical protein